MEDVTSDVDAVLQVATDTGGCDIVNNIARFS